MTLVALYEKLKDEPSGHEYSATEIRGHDGTYLGVDRSAHPCLFVKPLEASAEAPMRTAFVSLQLNQQYSLSGISGGAVERFHSLRCEASEATDIDTFLVLIEAFLALHGGERIDEKALTSFFRSVVRLFSVAPARDLDRERQGLWSELFVMGHIRGFTFWAPLWHSEITRRFDFSSPGRHVEVKSTVGAERIHHFSHGQIYASEGEEIVIASLMLREEDAGLSLRQLIEQARANLQGTDHYLKLERAVRHAGMESLDQTGPVYDAAEAERRLAWHRSTDAPHFLLPEPPGVSQTHYRVDLSTAPQMAVHELSGWLDLIAGPSLALKASLER